MNDINKWMMIDWMNNDDEWMKWYQWIWWYDDMNWMNQWIMN